MPFDLTAKILQKFQKNVSSQNSRSGSVLLENNFSRAKWLTLLAKSDTLRGLQRRQHSKTSRRAATARVPRPNHLAAQAFFRI